MGQLLRVVNQHPISDNVLRFEVDRSLTGMGLEVYDNDMPSGGQSVSSDLATRLLAVDSVVEVSIFSNVVTVQLDQANDVVKDDILDVIENLFTHYLPGVEPTPIPTSTN